MNFDDHIADSDGELLRKRLVTVALEWERRYGVAPSVTGALSEYDAARLIGHTASTYSLDCSGRTAVTRGADFSFGGLRYQVKACRPSGKWGSTVTNVPKAKNCDWDRLVWILYDRDYRVLEAWEWLVVDYRAAFDSRSRLSPIDMRSGRSLLSQS